MKHLKFLTPAVSLGVLSLASLNANAQLFTPGNLVLSRTGDGATALSGIATAVFLDQFNATDGSKGSSLALPTTASGSNHRVTNSGSATSNGLLNLSTNGQYLLYGGYDAALGTTGVATTASATVNRVVARVDGTGNINSTTALTDANDGNNFRSVASVDGSTFYTGGAGSTTGTNSAVRYATLGATTSTPISSNATGSLTNVRDISIQNNQLYASSASSTYFGVSTIGSGTPTTSGQPTTLLTGFPTTGASSYGFFFGNSTTLYVADDRATASGGGLQKWTFSNNTWSLSTTYKTGLTAGLRGLTGFVDGSGIVSLWATTADTVSGTAGNKLVSLVDAGATPTFNTLAVAPGNEFFEGISFAPNTVAPSVPAPSSLLVSLLGVPGIALLIRRRK